ncbi:tRNA-dihydrouridine(16/17) synthase [NAD(P)(+)]-like [Babesia sp. Xinjiang]|uniref:tRNA-dihydrouridine(16/17) synthase [NAD(P)(+)]-like n=1 Tax=Babesia sp. Xinjiang TaxID=462227 RepID=UPI000A230584|nr:tRNA-dihydrouridine(16/17) synthase [NAD(P)(+)]-like [Babesia sp. Xinjiang]ORM39741.1 tRNA-dihydrouridine(16/17) synthase [NAD(P)(+)]-like [Babesia sp. Xinjiang]
MFHPWPCFQDLNFIQLSQIQCQRPVQRDLKMPSYVDTEILPRMINLPNTSDSCSVIGYPEKRESHIYQIGETYLFNRTRTDTKHRKRAFTKRGYFRQSRSLLRKENRMKFAYALQGIDYEMLDGLKMGEIPDIKNYSIPGCKFFVGCDAMTTADDFWSSIGKPKYVAAPMVNQSELPFRILCRRYNAQLTFTPMLHGRIFAENEKYRAVHFQTAEIDTPLIAQVCGDDAAVLAQAASYLKGKVAAVDLNLGCPQGIAKDGHYGSFLLDEPDLVTGIVSRITQEVAIPVTCKVRKVDKDSLQSTLNFCFSLEQSGCKAITIHGRHRSEKGTNVREADWDAIRILKSRLRIPVIANGGIETFEDVGRCLQYTGADAVMSSEALLEKPYLFSGRIYDHLSIMQEYLDIVRLYPNHPPACVRGHAFKILYQHCQNHPNLRDRLAIAMTIDEFEEIVRSLRAAEDPESCYTHISGSWYRRHRNPSSSEAKTVPDVNYDTHVFDGFAGLFGG